jgi:hypothetical protein
MIVTDVAPRSLAGEAGLAAKDFLVSLDDEPAAGLAPQTWLYRSDAHRWVFYSRSRHERIELDATGIEPGVAVALSTDAIKERYDPRKSSPAELLALWEARDWPALLRLSDLTLAAYGEEGDTPALVFRGAALYETGERDEGIDLVNSFQERFASNWTMNFQAVGYYYQALDLLQGGQKETGIDLLHKAFEYHRCARLADAVEKHTRTRPRLVEPIWLDRVFPVDYRLPRIAAGGEVSLGEALAALGAGELLAVCLLATYRGNGPYNDFMQRYLNFGRWFAPFLKGLHVVTMEAERNADYPHYFRGEDAVSKGGLPFELLLEDGGVSEAVRQPASPFVVLLDREGRVCAEGELPSVDLWNALAKVEAGVGL